MNRYIRDKEPEGDHHKYCCELYKINSEWKCICDILKSYDKWNVMNSKTLVLKTK